jgi:hypothetical protein
MSDYKTTYPPQVQPEHLRPNDLYVREFQQGVTIPMTQNLFGGIGAFIVTAIIGWKAGMATEDFAALGLVIGGLLFGGSCVVRAFRDEVRFMLNAYGERQDKATRQALQAEVVQLREEMKRLRSHGVVSSQYVTLMVAERLLGDYFERHLDITRAPAMSRGYTRAQWDAAMRLCRTAQVVNEKGVVLVPTFAEAWAKVLHMQSAGMGSFAVTETGDVVRKG